MSGHVNPEQTAFERLETVVRLLGEEMAHFRQRALQAEAKLRTHEARTQPGDLFSEQKVSELRKENQELKRRLHEVMKRSATALEHVRFLRQQAEHSRVAEATPKKK